MAQIKIVTEVAGRICGIPASIGSSVSDGDDIVLVEAMSAGTCVVASDLGAFRRVLEEGEAGILFRNGDGDHLAKVLVDVLRDPARRTEVVAVASEAVRRYDWSVVTREVLTVYEMVLAASEATVRVTEDPRSRRAARLTKEVTS